MDQKIYKEELAHLDSVQARLTESKNVLEKAIGSMGLENLEQLRDMRANGENNGADFFFLLEQLNEKNQAFNLKDKYKRLEEIESLMRETYFARLDLSGESYYIGKFGFTDDRPIVIDWRAKVASVYYRYRYPQKNVSYETPDGKVVKDLNLKRTFEIDDGKLVKIYNNDLQLDENQIITDKIKTRTGGVLEDIVETIQEGQLDIIESDPRQITIVQGCVGSGKSTVAIHKLSHIFFNFPDLVHPTRSILIAKNQILVGYLSTLFPKLGIFDIYFKSLKDMVVHILFGENIKLNFDLSINQDTSSFDMEVFEKLSKELSIVNQNFENQIQALQELPENESFSGYIYNKKVSPYENLSEYIGEMEEELELQLFYIKEHAGSSKEWLWKENVKKIKKLINTLKKIRTTVKEHTLRELLAAIGINMHAKLGYMEALIIVYVYSRLVGLEHVKKFEYCVVDEGQDFSILEFLVMSTFVINGRFCILGDLNQAYQGDGITSWDDISKVIAEAHKAQTFVLDTNYRSTKPIIDLANQILDPFTKNYLPKSINRIGNEPVELKLSSKEDLLETFQKQIVDDIKQDKQSTGIIIFDQALYDETKQFLQKKLKNTDRFIELDQTKKMVYLPNGIYLMRFEDCKGLEFSKVYVLGLDRHKIKDYLNAKKAFVSVTRAMNDLTIMYHAN